MHKTIIPGLVLATVAALAGCSSSGGTTSPAVTASASPAAKPAAGLNPVDLISKAGGDAPADRTGNNTDARGNRYATGGIGSDFNGHRQEIRITTATATSTPWPQEPSTATDWYITGPGFTADLSGVTDDNGQVQFPVSPQTVAQRLGGTVVPRG